MSTHKKEAIEISFNNGAFYFLTPCEVECCAVLCTHTQASTHELMTMQLCYSMVRIRWLSSLLLAESSLPCSSFRFSTLWKNRKKQKCIVNSDIKNNEKVAKTWTYSAFDRDHTDILYAVYIYYHGLHGLRERKSRCLKNDKTSTEKTKIGEHEWRGAS